MEITECKHNVKCDLGRCRNRATRVVKLDSGTRHSLYACDKCLNELYTAIGETVIPKSVETAKHKSEKGKNK